MRRKTNEHQPDTLKPAENQTPSEREIAIAHGILEYWRTKPSAMHEFRRAVFGDRTADWIRARDFPPARYLEAAENMERSDDDACQRFLVKNRDEVAAGLRQISSAPDEPSNREWLLHVEYFISCNVIR